MVAHEARKEYSGFQILSLVSRCTAQHPGFPCFPAPRPCQLLGPFRSPADGEAHVQLIVELSPHPSPMCSKRPELWGMNVSPPEGDGHPSLQEEPGADLPGSPPQVLAYGAKRWEHRTLHSAGCAQVWSYLLSGIRAPFSFYPATSSCSPGQVVSRLGWAPCQPSPGPPPEGTRFSGSVEECKGQRGVCSGTWALGSLLMDPLSGRRLSPVCLSPWAPVWWPGSCNPRLSARSVLYIMECLTYGRCPKYTEHGLTVSLLPWKDRSRLCQHPGTPWCRDVPLSCWGLPSSTARPGCLLAGRLLPQVGLREGVTPTMGLFPKLRDRSKHKVREQPPTCAILHHPLRRRTGRQNCPATSLSLPRGGAVPVSIFPSEHLRYGRKGSAVRDEGAQGCIVLCESESDLSTAGIAS
ncbi:hypothetical protein Cadr_000006621 [Camelus dromedarius]|uniref:Uncharacterized protein n=1 Tax=Camelus dromedarius TaxID=9838 RepID=A0A5N4E7W5_CAMDR|nr:hypothetical protein Cadr_000006621 [Camelus dromedarius]